MDSPGLRRVAWLCWYLAALLLVTPCLFVPSRSPDLWLHIKTGEWIFAHGVPHTDPFSYTRAGHPWIDHEWLFQVLLYPCWRFAGDTGLTVVWVALLLALVLSVTHLCLQALPPLTALAVTGLTIVLLNLRSALTPELLSLLFFLVTCCWLADRRRSPHRVWGLVPLQVLWANGHGFAILGPLLTTWVWVGELVLRRYPVRWWGAHGPDHRAAQRLGRLSLMQWAALMCTPYGWRSVQYATTTIGSLIGGGQAYLAFVEELLSFASVGTWLDFAGFAGVALIGAASFLVRHHRFDVGLAVPFLISALVGGWVFRQVGFFALLAACTVAWNLAGDPRALEARGRWIVRGITVCGLCMSIWWANVYVHYHERPARISTQAVDYLAEHPLPGEVFNTFNYGAYMIFRCAPQRRVFIDGRTELYGPRFIRDDYTQAALDPSTWQRLVAQYHIRTVLLGRDEREGRFLARWLYRDPQWDIAYIDDHALLMVSASDATPSLATRVTQAQRWLPSLAARVEFLWEMGDAPGALRHLADQMAAQPDDPEAYLWHGDLCCRVAQERLRAAQPLTTAALATGEAWLRQAREDLQRAGRCASADHARVARLLAYVEQLEAAAIAHQADQ